MAGIRKYRKIAYVESESPAMVHPFAKISGICYGINWTRPVFHISTMTILKRLYKSHLSPTSPSTKPSSLSLFQISKQKPSKKKKLSLAYHPDRLQLPSEKIQKPKMHLSTIITLFVAGLAPAAILAAPAESHGPPPSGISGHMGPPPSGTPPSGTPPSGTPPPKPTGTPSGPPPSGIFSGPPPTSTPA